MISNETVTVRGVIAFPSFETPDRFSEKFQVDIGNLSPAAVEKLEELGVDVKSVDDDTYGRGSYIRCRSKWPIVPVDASGNSFEGATNTIGYGSVARVTIKPYPYSIGGKSGVSPKITTIVIEELVSATGGDAGENNDVL